MTETRNLTVFWKSLVIILTVCVVFFLMYTSLFRPFHPALQGSVILFYGIAITFITCPVSKRIDKLKTTNSTRLIFIGGEKSPSLLDIILAASGAFPCVYIMVYWASIVANPMTYGTCHIVMGAILFIILMEAARRTVGWTIPVVVTLFASYALLGHFIPGDMGHAGFSLEELLYSFYLTTEGIWGLLTDLTSRLIAIFILLGPVLFACGVGNAFIKWAHFMSGRIDGGAGLIALFSSAGLGMLTGSSVANVATTGSLTIPTMYKLGYKREISGAIEAASSSIGQIMPPLMGAGAFVMAELIGVRYTSIMIAAIIPAICKFVGTGSGIYILSKKYGCGKLSKDMTPEWSELLNPSEILCTVIPIGIIFFLLVIYKPPQNCAAWAILSAIVIFLATGGKLTPSEVKKRIKIISKAYFTASTKALVMLTVMMSSVQVIVMLINITGLGFKLSEVIIRLTDGNTFFLLTAVMAVTIFPGMGLSTTAAYVITASVLGHTLAMQGLPPLNSHMFIFYFAIAAGITPPVCIAVFAASAISKGKWSTIALIAMGLNIGGYLIPFYFIYQPVILTHDNVLTTALILPIMITGMFFIEVGIFGYLRKPASWFERVLFIAGGMLFMKCGWFTISIGLACLTISTVSHVFTTGGRRAAKTR